MQAAKQLAQHVGVARACEALNVPRSSYYATYHPRPPKTKLRRPSHRKLTPEEERHVLAVLNSPRFMDMSPREIYATLLDEGIYLCSVSTMYRILRAHNQVRERRNQRIHPPYTKPRLVATRPNQVWTWDITKLAGPRPGVYYSLYVILDLYSRYVVGWMAAEAESGGLARKLLYETFVKHGIQPQQLTLHSDRGAPMTSKMVAQLLATLGITKTHSRPRQSNDNAYSEAQFKTLKYRPDFPDRFGSLEDAQAFCRRFFAWYNNEHYHTGLGLLTPHQVHYGLAKEVIAQRNQVLAAAYAAHPERFVRKPPTADEPAAEVWINQPTAETIEFQPLTTTSAV
mgnify:FL=1